jgi:YHS domain-containing protein
MTDKAVTSGQAFEYGGAKYTVCCGGCAPAFKAQPKKYATNDKATVGEFLFDPVSGARLDWSKTALPSTDYKGLRYRFASKENQAIFAKEPAKFTKTPEKESLVCPISGEDIDGTSNAAGYVDFKGVRYYVCCTGCLPELKEATEKYATTGKGKPTPVAVGPWKDGKAFAHDK